MYTQRQVDAAKALYRTILLNRKIAKRKAYHKEYYGRDPEYRKLYMREYHRNHKLIK